jgi:hypothetical protein
VDRLQGNIGASSDCLRIADAVYCSSPPFCLLIASDEPCYGCVVSNLGAHYCAAGKGLWDKIMVADEAMLPGVYVHSK